MTKYVICYNIRQMKRSIISLLALTTIFLLSAKAVKANEGVFSLESVESSGSCYALSVYDDARFEILMSCQSLETPFSAELNRYMLWVEDDQGDISRLGEIDRGKYEGSIGSEFVRMFVTAEGKRTPRSPSEQVVVSGTVEDIPFATRDDNEQEEEVREADKEVDEQVDEQVEQEENGQDEQNTAGSILRTVGRVFLIALVILIGVVVVMTVITRRKGGV